jgi:hypothetical protein
MSEDEFRFLSVRRVPLRLTVEETAWLLKCTVDDVHALAREGYLKPLGKPPVTGKKFFHTKELLELADNPAWLARITNAIYKRWHVKNGSRKRNELQLHFNGAVAD